MMNNLSLCLIFHDSSMIGLNYDNVFLAPEKKMMRNILIPLFFNCSYIVMTTSGGIMDHEEARRKHLGGKILGFFF